MAAMVALTGSDAANNPRARVLIRQMVLSFIMASSVDPILYHSH